MQAEENFLFLINHPDTRKEGFKQLVKAYERPLYSVIRKMVIDHDETKDLLQDTFIRVWEKIDSFNSESRLYTWVYRIAINLCLQHLKKKKRISLMGLESRDQLIEKLSVNDSLNGDEIQYKLQLAILKLPDKQRLIFHMKYYEDLNYADIASMTETSEGALRATYHHAVKKIEKFLKEG